MACGRRPHHRAAEPSHELPPPHPRPSGFARSDTKFSHMKMDTVTLLLLIALPFWLGLLAWLWRTEHRRQRNTGGRP
jgi:hypothetical protein